MAIDKEIEAIIRYSVIEVLQHALQPTDSDLTFDAGHDDQDTLQDTLQDTIRCDGWGAPLALLAHSWCGIVHGTSFSVTLLKSLDD